MFDIGMKVDDVLQIWWELGSCVIVRKGFGLGGYLIVVIFFKILIIGKELCFQVLGLDKGQR